MAIPAAASPPECRFLIGLIFLSCRVVVLTHDPFECQSRGVELACLEALLDACSPVCRSFGQQYSPDVCFSLRTHSGIWRSTHETQSKMKVKKRMLGVAESIAPLLL